MDPERLAEQIEACHWLLLRLAGTVPDDLSTQCRRWLADGDACTAGRAVAYAVISKRIRLTDSDIDLLAELLGAADVDASALHMVGVLDDEPMPTYAFAPWPADAERQSRLGAADDRPRVPAIDMDTNDAIDQAVIRELLPDTGVRAVWRAWRSPGNGAPWPPPRRVYVVEADERARLAAITAMLQSVVIGAGDDDPRVEVYPVRASLPSYQRLARSCGALIWAREPDPGLRLATVLDRVDECGEVVDLHRSFIATADADRLLEYLRQGQPLLVTTACTNDVMNPALGAVVPTNFRTDGHWIWNDACAYYLQTYGLALEADLVVHIEQRDFVVPYVDGAAMHRALAALKEPASDEPAWTYGT